MARHVTSQSFAEYEREHRRLAILSMLMQASEYQLNESLLASTLHAMALTVSHDALRTQLAWLREQGLVTIEEVAGLQIATLTQRGMEAAQGIIEVPGVRRPPPAYHHDG